MCRVALIRSSSVLAKRPKETPFDATTNRESQSDRLGPNRGYDRELQQLLVVKRRFIVPATLFFVVYYFALPVLVG